MSNPVTPLPVGRPRIRSALTILAEQHQHSLLDTGRAPLFTGFDPLDQVLGGGIRPGELVLVGGKPGVGKTIACLQWARAMAQQGAVVVYLCYEHDERTLLTRLLLCELGDLIASTPDGPNRAGQDELQGRIRDAAAGLVSLRDALESDPMLEATHRRLVSYADRLILITGSGTHTDVTAVSDILRQFEGQPIALFIDYVQKVPVFPAAATDAERVGRVVESLKQVALDQDLVVVGIAAADHLGLSTRRLHLRHFRGSTALVYEADAVLVLNEKLAIVSRAHVAHAPHRAEEFQRQIVFSVEKNRNGLPDLHLEFEKDFALYRFRPRGRWVSERLWTEGSVEE